MSFRKAFRFIAEWWPLALLSFAISGVLFGLWLFLYEPSLLTIARVWLICVIAVLFILIVSFVMEN